MGCSVGASTSVQPQIHICTETTPSKAEEAPSLRLLDPAPACMELSRPIQITTNIKNSYVLFQFSSPSVPPPPLQKPSTRSTHVGTWGNVKCQAHRPGAERPAGSWRVESSLNYHPAGSTVARDGKRESPRVFAIQGARIKQTNAFRMLPLALFCG